MHKLRQGAGSQLLHPLNIEQKNFDTKVSAASTLATGLFKKMRKGFKSENKLNNFSNEGI